MQKVLSIKPDNITNQTRIAAKQFIENNKMDTKEYTEMANKVSIFIGLVTEWALSLISDS